MCVEERETKRGGNCRKTEHKRKGYGGVDRRMDERRKVEEEKDGH